MLLGVHGEGSGVRTDEVYVSVLTMPMFVPADYVTLNHARRVPSGTATFGLANEALSGALASAIAQIPTQTVALESIAASVSEESAYAALLLDRSDAEERLANDFAPGDHRSFVEVARHRRRSVLDTLRSSGVDQAKQLLREWRDATVDALGIA